MWFLLTGQGPRVWPLRFQVEPQMTQPAMRALVEPGRHYMRTVVTLEVEPWVDAKSVARAYRAIQQRLSRGRDKRRIGERNLHVFAFVVQHVDPRGERPSYAELTTRWNALAGIPDEWRYPNPRRFHRDFGRARDALLFGQYDSLSAFTSIREETWSPPGAEPGNET